MKFIHVSQDNIKRNVSQPAAWRLPVLSMRDYDESGNVSDEVTAADELHICDQAGNVVARVVYRPEKNVHGAQVWIDADFDVKAWIRNPTGGLEPSNDTAMENHNV